MKLIKFLMKMKNETITVEMKNGTVVIGTIVLVDNKMNIYLKQCKVTQKKDPTLSLENYNIRGSMIRYIILPETLPIDTLLVDDNPNKRNKINKNLLNKVKNIN